MKDLTREIPQRAYINAEILQDAVASGSLQRSVTRIQRKYGLTHYEFLNPAYVISLLYCLLVVPKELWLGKDKTHPIYTKIEQSNPLQWFELDVTDGRFSEAPVYYLIHNLRNSIAHANFSVNNLMEFVFWDVYGDKEPHFRVKISIKNVSRFITHVGSILANIRFD